MPVQRWNVFLHEYNLDFRMFHLSRPKRYVILLQRIFWAQCLAIFRQVQSLLASAGLPLHNLRPLATHLPSFRVKWWMPISSSPVLERSIFESCFYCAGITGDFQLFCKSLVPIQHFHLWRARDKKGTRQRGRGTRRLHSANDKTTFTRN